MISLTRLLTELGIEGEVEGHELVARCPNAGAHQGGRDENPSWRIVIDPTHDRYGYHFCHPCGFGGGVHTLIRHVRGCTSEEAAHLLGELPAGEGWVVPIHLPRTVESRLASRGMEGLPGECVPLEDPRVPDWVRTYWRLKVGTPVRTAAGFDARYGLSGRLSRRLVFPARTAGLLLGYSARVVDFRPLVRSTPGEWPARSKRDRDSWLKEREEWSRLLMGRDGTLFDAARAWLRTQTRMPGIRYLTPRIRPGPRGQVPERGADTTRALFFWDQVWPPLSVQPEVTLVEGAIKAVRLYHAGWPNPVGIPGASGLNSTRIALLAQAGRIWYPGDPDQAGERLGRELVDAVAGRFTTVVPIQLRKPVDELSVPALRRIFSRAAARA